LPIFLLISHDSGQAVINGSNISRSKSRFGKRSKARKALSFICGTFCQLLTYCVSVFFERIFHRSLDQRAVEALCSVCVLGIGVGPQVLLLGRHACDHGLQACKAWRGRNSGLCICCQAACFWGSVSIISTREGRSA